MKKRFGKYKGVVAGEPKDDLGRGRIQVTVERILPEPTWAEPCVPYAAPGKGFLMVPPDGADVWVEFAEGDISRPIWTGCFWSDRFTTPLTPQVEKQADTKVLVMEGFDLRITEASNGAKVELKLGSVTITADPNAVTIEVGSGGGTIELTSSAMNVHGTAMTVDK